VEEKDNKSIVDDIFEKYEQEAKETKKEKDVDSEEFDIALDHAQEDIEEFHGAFMEFQDKIGHLKITDYFEKHLGALGSKGSFIELVISGEYEGSIPKDLLKDESKEKVIQKLQELRAQILADVYKYYENDAPF